MDANEGNRPSSTSPKEKEKLKQRLRILFKQHEQKTRQNKASKLFQKKNRITEEPPQQANGHLQNTATEQSDSSKTQEKSGKKENNNTKKKSLNVGGATEKIANKKPSHGVMGNTPSDKKVHKKPKKSKKTTNIQKQQPSPTPKANQKQKPMEVPSQKFKEKKLKKAAQNPQIQKPTTFQSMKKTDHNKQKMSNVPLTNSEPNLIKNQKQKTKKRTAVQVQDNISGEIKKPKLDQPKANVNPKKKKKKKSSLQNNQNAISPSENKTVSKLLNTKRIPGFVEGGDFEYDSDEDADYWDQQISQDDDSYSDFDFESGHGDYSEDESYLEEDVFGDDPYNYSDLDEDDLEKRNNTEEDAFGDDPYDYSDFDEEEEDEHYSDFDEDDYEEDDDSYDYSYDSQISSNYEEEDDSIKCFDFNDEREDDDDDEDFKLPENVPEDLIVHSGTAVKRDILPEDNVVFKNKKRGLQLIELKDQEVVEIVHQRKEYSKEELVKLTRKENNVVKIETDAKSEQVKSSTSSAVKDECPKLVPIADKDESDDEDIEDEFRMMNGEKGEVEEYSHDENYSFGTASLGSEYNELNSEEADSLLSEDINDKYLYRGQNNDSDDACYMSNDDDVVMTAKQTADVIDATNCHYKIQKKRGAEKVTDEVENFDQLPSQRLFNHVKVGTKSDVISATIIDPKLLEERENKLKEITTSKGELKPYPEETELYHDKMNISQESEESLNTDQSKNTSLTEECYAKDNTDQNINCDETAISLESPNTCESKQPANRLKTTAQNRAEYNTLFYNAINANLVLVLIKDPFYIYGTVRLTLLAGSVDVYGHCLAKDKEVELFSPRGCSVIEISSKPTTAEQSFPKEKVKNILKNYESNFILRDLENIVNSYKPEEDAVVLLRRNDERKKVVQQFKKFMNENVFPNLQNITMDRPLYNSEYLLKCMINTSATEHKCLRLPEQWRTFTVTTNSRVMLVGGKGVGKSTLLRYLINKQITLCEKVLLIDLDIGQPEMFVPQTVSCSIVEKPLLGPGFFLNIQPEKSYAVGHTNIALCAHKYVDAVKSLICYCLNQTQFQNIPWFVNTMGYNKGFGPELISIIANELPLTDVIQLQSNKAINNFDNILFPHVVSQVQRNMFVDCLANGENRKSESLSYRLHVWQSVVTHESRYQKEWDMSPKDMRYAMLLTRLSEALRGHAEWLSDCKPMSAPLNQLKLINLTDNVPPCTPEELAKAMEANLVYLCQYEDNLLSVECLGIGVVRGVDYHVQQIYLIPAVSSPSLLKRVNCLALGEMPLPNSLFTNQGSRVQNTAPFVYNTIEAKASKAIKQIYHRPASFLKGSHKPL